MSNQNNRGGDDEASSNDPVEEGRRTSGGHMGAGRSGNEDLGSEKPADRDNMGSNQPGRKNEH